MNANPLYRQPNPMYERMQAPIGVATADCAGAHGGNLKYTDMDSINGLRMTKGAKTIHRIPANVKPCSGYVEASKARVLKSNPYSNKELRKLAIKVLNSRGIKTTDHNIGLILSGKTL
jgi:hypothetical protein